MLTEKDGAGEWIVGGRFCVESWKVFVEHSECKTWSCEDSVG
jgi:hypothetical protein